MAENFNFIGSTNKTLIHNLIPYQLINGYSKWIWNSTQFKFEPCDPNMYLRL